MEVFTDSLSAIANYTITKTTVHEWSKSMIFLKI